MDCIVHGVAKSPTRPSDFHFHFHTHLEQDSVRSVAGASPWPAQRPLVVAAPPRRRRKWEGASSPKPAPSIRCPNLPSASAQSVSLLAFKSWVFGGPGPPVKNWIWLLSTSPPPATFLKIWGFLKNKKNFFWPPFGMRDHSSPTTDGSPAPSSESPGTFSFFLKKLLINWILQHILSELNLLICFWPCHLECGILVLPPGI